MNCNERSEICKNCKNKDRFVQIASFCKNFAKINFSIPFSIVFAYQFLQYFYNIFTIICTNCKKLAKILLQKLQTRLLKLSIFRTIITIYLQYFCKNHTIFAILISFFKINIVLQRLGPQKGPRSPSCAFMQKTIFAIVSFNRRLKQKFSTLFPTNGMIDRRLGYPQNLRNLCRSITLLRKFPNSSIVYHFTSTRTLSHILFLLIFFFTEINIFRLHFYKSLHTRIVTMDNIPIQAVSNGIRYNLILFLNWQIF